MDPVDNHILILYYKDNNDLLDKYLLWLMGEKVLQEFILDLKVNGISAESFMVLARRLIFVQNKNKIRIYDL